MNGVLLKYLVVLNLVFINRVYSTIDAFDFIGLRFADVFFFIFYYKIIK